MPETVWKIEAPPTASRLKLAPQSISLLLVTLAAIAYCGWILSLPLFPTQDGPIHLYYVRILQALLFHRDPGLFPHYYLVKHVAPPYALYYYLLLTLGHFVSLVAADKLVICLYIVLFLFGFRFLARSLGPSGDAISLLAIPYVLNWPLGMGFVNFCLSLALSCWALGLWCRVAQQPESPHNLRRLLGFVALAWLIMFTHPVPLLFLLGFCLVELCVRWLRSPVANNSAFRQAAFAFAIASTTLLYVKAFTTSHVAGQVDPIHTTYLAKLGAAIGGIATFSTVDLFSPDSPLSVFRRVAIYVVFFVAVVSAASPAVRLLRSPARRLRWSLANTFCMLSLALCVAIPILPPDMNNSHLFSSRLVLFAVLAALAAASGAPMPRLQPERKTIACAAVAILLFAVTLTLAFQTIAPVARNTAQLETLPPPPQGIYLALLNPHYGGSAPGLEFDPYWWDQARPLRRSDSILFNTPWLDLSIIALGAQPVLPTGRLPAYDLDMPMLLREDLARSAEARSILFPPLTGIIVNHAELPVQAGLDPALQEDPDSNRLWVCTPYAFTSICAIGVKPDRNQPAKAYNRQQ